MSSPEAAPAAFADRTDAGRRLAGRLADLAADPSARVVALPRGGVAVGAALAQALALPLGVFLVRKIGAPGNPELALGAIAADGTRVLDPQLVAELHVSPGYLDAVIGAESAELARRAERLRPWLDTGPVAGGTARTLILVDDGVATGSTVAAALRALRARGESRLVLAVPVGPPAVLAALAELADRVEVLSAPPNLRGVSAWYDDFRQITDDEVVALLAATTPPPGDSPSANDGPRRPGRGL
jgi:predicted phosphoribosyltransferase